MIYQIYKKNESDFELVGVFEVEADAMAELTTLRADGGDYHMELINGSFSTIMGV
jgi:hypothetical protein